MARSSPAPRSCFTSRMECSASRRQQNSSSRQGCGRSSSSSFCGCGSSAGELPHVAWGSLPFPAGRRRLLPRDVCVSSVSQHRVGSSRISPPPPLQLGTFLALLLCCCCGGYTAALQLQGAQHQGPGASSVAAATTAADAAAGRAAEAAALLAAAALIRQSATAYLFPRSPCSASPPRAACSSLYLPSSACGFINAVTRSAAAPLTNVFLGPPTTATTPPAAAATAATAVSTAAAGMSGATAGDSTDFAGGTSLPTNPASRAAAAAAETAGGSFSAVAAAGRGDGGEGATRAGRGRRSSSKSSQSAAAVGRAAATAARDAAAGEEGERDGGGGGGESETPSPLAVTLRSYLRCHMSLLSDTSPAFTNSSLIFLFRAADAHERLVSPLELFTNRMHLPGAAPAQAMAAAESQAVAAAIAAAHDRSAAGTHKTETAAEAAAADVVAAAEDEKKSKTQAAAERNATQGGDEAQGEDTAAAKLFKKELLQFEVQRLHRLLQFVCAARLRGAFLDKGATKIMFELLQETGLPWEDVEEILLQDLRRYYQRELPAEDFTEHFDPALKELVKQLLLIKQEFEEERAAETAKKSSFSPRSCVEREADPDPRTLTPLLLDITRMDDVLPGVAAWNRKTGGNGGAA